MKKILTSLALVMLMGIAHADGALLFRAQLSEADEKTSLTADESRRLASHRSRPFTREVAVIAFDKNALFSNVVRVPSSTGEVFEFTKTGDETTKDGIYVWKGKSKTQGDMIMSVGDGTVLGDIVEGSTHLSIMSLGRDSKYQAVLRVDPRGLPPTHPEDLAASAPAHAATQGVRK